MSGHEAALEKLRAACLKRGASGIKALGRTFRIYDDDASRMLSVEEFGKGMHDYGTGLTDSEVATLFAYFDRDQSGQLDFNEFLGALRPPMSQSRINLIKQAFNKLDKDGSGVVTVSDLETSYDVRNHPKFQSGEKTKKQILREFLDNFQLDERTKDDKVTFEEFELYYAGVSASIDQDLYFDLMMRNAWKL